MESLNYRNASAPRVAAANEMTGASVSPVDRTITALSAYFAQNPDARCLVVVDPSRRRLVDRRDEGLAFSEQPSAVIAIEHESFPKEHLPYLVELDLSTRQGKALLCESVSVAFEDRRPDLVARGQGQRIGGWLASTVPMQEMADHLARHALQRDDRGRQCVLRFYDSRSLSLIWPILMSGQRQSLLGPVLSWHALDASASLCAYSADAPLQSELALTPDQWRAIHGHGVVNKALGLHMYATQRQPHKEEVEAAASAAARAENHGLVDHDDKVSFVGHALAWHPHFDAHSSVSRALQQLSEDVLYVEVIGELSGDEIEDIKRGAWMTETAVR